MTILLEHLALRRLYYRVRFHELRKHICCMADIRRHEQYDSEN